MATALEHGYRLMHEQEAFVQRPEGILEVGGEDAVEFLQGQVTNDVASLSHGEGCYALLLNPKGRILADMRVFKRSSDLFWLHSERLDALFAELDRYMIGRQVQLQHRPTTVLSVIGPRSRDVVAVEVPEQENDFVETDVGGAPVIAVATDLGVDLLLAPEDRGTVEEALVTHDAEPVTEEAAEIVRVETGRPRYGVDMTDQNLPGELGLEARAISFTKGCYVGQEPVARMHYKGHPNRHLRGLELSLPADGGEQLRRDGNAVGSVTSACVSPTFGPIALALVRREAQPGDEVELLDGETRATVIELPFKGS